MLKRTTPSNATRPSLPGSSPVVHHPSSFFPPPHPPAPLLLSSLAPFHDTYDRLRPPRTTSRPHQTTARGPARPGYAHLSPATQNKGRQPRPPPPTNRPDPRFARRSAPTGTAVQRIATGTGQTTSAPVPLLQTRAEPQEQLDSLELIDPVLERGGQVLVGDWRAGRGMGRTELPLGQVAIAR